MKETCLVAFSTIYMCGAVWSFGHSAVAATKTMEFVPWMNASTLGIAWPLYLSYVLQDKEPQNDE